MQKWPVLQRLHSQVLPKEWNNVPDQRERSVFCVNAHFSTKNEGFQVVETRLPKHSRSAAADHLCITTKISQPSAAPGVLCGILGKSR